MVTTRLIEQWREKNFNVAELVGRESFLQDPSKEVNSKLPGRSLKSRIMKQRNLATHLVNFSSDTLNDLSSLQRRSTEVYFYHSF
jgi:hypothetical protein